MTGKELRRRRELIGLSQVALADALGLAPNTIARWERGELSIGSPKMLNLALNSLKAAGFRSALADVGRKLPRVNVAAPDRRIESRIRMAAERMRTWIEYVSALPDTSLEKAVRDRTSFPGYRVLRRLATDPRLNPQTRSEISWATHSGHRALEIAQRIWSYSWLDVTTNSSARRKRFER